MRGEVEGGREGEGRVGKKGGEKAKRGVIYGRGEKGRFEMEGKWKGERYFLMLVVVRRLVGFELVHARIAFRT